MKTYCAAPTVQIAIINHPKAKPLKQRIRTMIAGAAPSATLIEGLEKININVLHVYGLTETYGPFTSCIELPEWKELDTKEYYRRKAMQGSAYVTSDEVRVIRTDSSAAHGYEDVTPDGKEVGEIVVRGNMVMKGQSRCAPLNALHVRKYSLIRVGSLAMPDSYPPTRLTKQQSTTTTPKRPPKRSKVDTSTLETWPS